MRERQACYQYKGIKFIHPLFSTQNGRFTPVKGSPREQFHVQGVLQRCLLLRPFAQKPTTISSMSMEGKNLRVLVSIFRSGTSTSDAYRFIKDSHCNFEMNSNNSE